MQRPSVHAVIGGTLSGPPAWADDEVRFLAVEVHTLPPGAYVPALVEGYFDGQPVTIPCSWRDAFELQWAIAEAQGEPVVAVAPRYALLYGRVRP